MSEAGAVKAQAGKIGGNFHAPPPPEKPKDWKALGILQYKHTEGVFEFRMISTANLPEEVREQLHENHGITAVQWEAK